MSDARGFAVLALPIPADPSLRGARLLAQSIWPSSCGAQGYAASDALELTVQ